MSLAISLSPSSSRWAAGAFVTEGLTTVFLLGEKAPSKSAIFDDDLQVETRFVGCKTRLNMPLKCSIRYRIEHDGVDHGPIKLRLLRPFLEDGFFDFVGQRARPLLE